jgi:hypothetical protein
MGNRVDSGRTRPINGSTEATVSLVAAVPAPLALALKTFIDHHPHWDQYRLFQAALAGFLVQHGVGGREVTRWYLAHLFPGQGGFSGGRIRALPRVVPPPQHEIDQAA